MGPSDLNRLERALTRSDSDALWPLTGWTSARVGRQVTLDGDGRPYREIWSATVSTKRGDAVLPLHQIFYLSSKARQPAETAGEP